MLLLKDQGIPHLLYLPSPAHHGRSRISQGGLRVTVIIVVVVVTVIIVVVVVTVITVVVVTVISVVVIRVLTPSRSGKRSIRQRKCSLINVNLRMPLRVLPVWTGC